MKEQINPVSINYDSKGNPDGVRVRTLDEDFVIALYDMRDASGRLVFEPFAYLMEHISKGAFNTFNKKQALIVAAYKDEIDYAMKDANGERMISLYSTTSSIDEIWKWTYNSDYGILNRNYKSNCFKVRTIIDNNKKQK